MRLDKRLQAFDEKRRALLDEMGALIRHLVASLWREVVNAEIIEHPFLLKGRSSRVCPSHRGSVNMSVASSIVLAT